MKIPRQLCLRREERWPALVALAVIVALNALMVGKYYDVFAKNIHGGFWGMFTGKFHVSGYDPILYLVMSVWRVLFNGFRHPLLLWMLYPAACLNEWLMPIAGINCAQLITAAMLIVADFASFVLFHRLLRDVVGLCRADTALLTALFFSFAYVMVPMVVPDHFAFSLCLLLLTLYVCGRHMRDGTPLSAPAAALLMVVTAGVTLSNGVKVALGQWMANGRRFFAWRNLLVAMALPSALLLWAGFSVGGVPQPKTDADLQQENANLRKNNMPTHADHGGEPISTVGFMNWTDATTSRLDAAVENLFGESLQLHSDHLLGDVWIDRPVVVRYSLAANYVVEAALVLLFALGAWCGRCERFAWLCLSWFAVDMALSMGLGFAINEIYIMGPHWLFVMPISMAYAMLRAKGAALKALRVATGCLAAWLWAYNGTLFVGFMLG